MSSVGVVALVAAVLFTAWEWNVVFRESRSGSTQRASCELRERDQQHELTCGLVQRFLFT